MTEKPRVSAIQRGSARLCALSRFDARWMQRERVSNQLALRHCFAHLTTRLAKKLNEAQ